MKTRLLSAVLAGVFSFWIPGAAQGQGPAQILGAPMPAQAQDPQPDRDSDRKQLGERAQARRRGARPRDASGGSGASRVPADVVPALPPCPVTMVLIAPFGHDCVVTLSFSPAFWVGYAEWPSPPARLSRQDAIGLLRLQVTPQTAHVYVDGYYTATVGTLDLVAGPHRIEIKAPFYEPLSFEVNIAPNETITYEGDLQPVSYEPYVPAKAGIPKTFYMIPGCYAGDRPPQSIALPRGCDISRLHSY